MSKFAVITGASSGLGAEFAKQLASLGYSLLLIARREDDLKEIAQNLNTRVEVLPLDLTDDFAVSEVLNYLHQYDIKPDLLINNAGFGALSSALTTEVNLYDQMIDLNVKALTRLTLGIALIMKSQNRGQILNVASIAAFCPCPQFAVYGATKAFVLAFSENLAMEFRPYGITVTALCPGPVRTNFWQTASVKNTGDFDFCMVQPQDVVREALSALRKQKINEIPGGLNKILYIATKLAPRSVSRVIAHKIFSRILRKNK